MLNRRYWDELARGIRERGHRLHHVLIEADERQLRRRISEDEVLHRAAGWRLQHLPAYFAAREAWLGEAADLVVDTTELGPRAAARRIADAARAWTIHDLGGSATEPGPP